MGYKVLDLFSGAGGFSLGFQKAGYNIVGGVEMDKDASSTHSYNFPKADDIQGDITKVTDEEVLKLYGNKGVDVIIGGPSCQSFSNANRTEDPYSEKAKERNKLFFEVLRFTTLLEPEVVVIENVPQILTQDKGYAKIAIQNYLEDLGYTVTVKVLLASEYGVPEDRRRAFFVAMKGKTFDFDKIEKKPLVTVKDTLSDIYSMDENGQYIDEPQTDYQQYLREGSVELTSQEPKRHGKDKIHRMSKVPQGGNWKDIPEESYLGVKFNEKVTHSSTYRRLHEDETSNTIVSKLGNIHPIKDREITVREGARIQSFPDKFLFKGTKTKQALQVGNAVPPLLAKAIAKEIKRVLEEEEKKKE